MIKMTRSLEVWLFKYYPSFLPLISLGHVELFTKEMQKEYYDWCRTEEGKQYLEGGSKYREINEVVKR